MSENPEMEKYFEFLDGLRETGITNMYGAGPYLREEFGVDRAESHRILKQWMETYEARHPRARPEQ